MQRDRCQSCHPAHLGMVSHLHAPHHHTVAEPHTITNHTAFTDADIRANLAAVTNLSRWCHHHIAHNTLGIVQGLGVVDVQRVQVEGQTCNTKHTQTTHISMRAGPRTNQIRSSNLMTTSYSPLLMSDDNIGQQYLHLAQGALCATDQYT
eukprot:GHUV01014063.1.p1 GENE.GHUV01014063.1~~GHUV01014063.1.p1  ORF type:complete len:150 (+),score=15.93 GHUV01014063.1:1599-2048(+)